MIIYTGLILKLFCHTKKFYVNVHIGRGEQEFRKLVSRKVPAWETGRP